MGSSKVQGLGFRFGRQRGYTLIELMVVIVVLALLASIGVPSYMNQVRRANRADAREALTIAANAQERFFATNSAYTADLNILGLPTAGGVTRSKNGHYQITVQPGNTGAIATSYRLTAVPVAGDTQTNDVACALMSLDSAGVHLPNPAISDCW